MAEGRKGRRERTTQGGRGEEVITEKKREGMEMIGEGKTVEENKEKG